MLKKKQSVQPSEKRVHFKLSAPEAKDVVLCGSFNRWVPHAHPLEQDKKGTWSTHVALEPGTHEYRFLVDGQWQDDPDAAKVLNPYGTQNCVRVVI